MNLPLSARSSTSIASPVKRMDEKVSEEDTNSGTVSTETDWNNDVLFDESVTDAATSELLESLKSMDESESVSSWKSETSIHFGSNSCASTQSDFSTCDSESALDLEEALMKALFGDSESVELPSELIVPYPDECGDSQKRPTPWDSSSSEDCTSSSSQIMAQAIRKVGATPPCGNAFSDNQPLVPRRRRSNDAISNPGDSRQNRPRRRTSEQRESGANHATQGDLHSFLMSRLPSSIVAKLDPNEWSHVCSEATTFAQSKNAFTASASEVKLEEHGNDEASHAVLQQQNDEVESCSVISELTGATGLTGLNHKQARTVDFQLADDTSLVAPPTTQPEKPSSGLKSRAWNDSSKCFSDAPIMPIRRGRPNLERTNSEPRSQHSLPRAFSRSSSLPCDIVSVNRRKVSFDTVQVRHYEPVLDWNPSTSQGPSLGIGWNYFLDSPKKVADIEDQKEKLGRRSMREIIIPRHIREQKLKECGYTPKEIAKAVRMNLKSKGQRMQTIHNYKIDQIVERSSRKVRRLFNPNRYPSRYQEI